MQLQNGLVHAAGTTGTPFALLSVPALLAATMAQGAATAQRALGFAQLTADFELRDGEAITTGLHFDGDAEILMRGRVGLGEAVYGPVAPDIISGFGILLTASVCGAGVALDSQPLELPWLREVLRTQLSDAACPHLVLRIGLVTQVALSVRREPGDVLFPAGDDRADRGTG